MTTQPPPTITAMAIWLLRHTSRIRQHPDAGTIAADIAHATMAAQRTIDRPPARIYAGPCPACGADLLGKPGHATIVCRQCGQPSVVAERQEAMRNAMVDYLYTATEMNRVLIGLGLQVKSNTIVKWAERGRLKADRSYDLAAGRWVTRYKVGDVIKLAIEQAQRV